MSEERDLPDDEAAARLARQLGVGRTPAGDAPDDPEDGLGTGRLRLDKDGTLVGRPKLAPVRALRDGDEPDPSDAAPGETSEAAPDEAPSESVEDGPRRAVLPPKRAALRPDGFIPPSPDDDEPLEATVDDAVSYGDDIEIEGGPFPFAEDAMPRFISSYHIDRFPTTNRDYEQFVLETHHRPPAYWPEGVLPDEIADHPVVGVDYYDALAYAQWGGKDLPFEDEWERAARGTDGRTYPWGDESELSAANTARVGLKMTVPVTLYRKNESPDGCRDMVGNVWELTHSPAAGGGVVVRGGSWYDFALYAKTYFRFATAPDARNGTIGFRCVRRHAPRPDEPREVDSAMIEAEIASRRGSRAPVDTSEFSAERRDLVIDSERLRAHVTDIQAESMLGPIRPGARTAPNPLDPRSMLNEGVSRDIARKGPEPDAEDDFDDADRTVAESIKARIVTPPPKYTVPPDEERPMPPSSSGVAPAEGGRVHVTGGATSSGNSGGPFKFQRPDAAEIEHAAEQVEQTQRTEAATADTPAARSMPKAMWALLAVGFALFGALIASLLTGDKTNLTGPAEPKVADVKPSDDGEELIPAKQTIWDRIPAFPAYGKGAHDGEPPKVLDSLNEQDVTELDHGTWALFFLNPDEDAGRNSLPAIHRLHRRAVERGLRVAVVIDRIKFEVDTGGLLEARAMAARLRTYKLIADGLTVILDKNDMLKSRFARAGKALYASLVHRGQVESRTRPPRSSPGFQRDHLIPLVKRATQLLPDLLTR